MASKVILSVGFDFPGGEVEQIPYLSDRTLLDGDIILFVPLVYWRNKVSPQVVRHWHSELSAALAAEKLVIVYLEKPDVDYYAGERVLNYDMIPAKLDPKAKTGWSVTLLPEAAFLQSYWAQFGEMSPYKVILEANPGKPLLMTKSGKRVIGSIMQWNGGTMLLLPPVSYDEEAFTELRDGEEFWTNKAEQFGKRLINEIVKLDKTIRNFGARTPPPDWTLYEGYRTEVERDLELKITKKSSELKMVQDELANLEARLDQAGGLRRLLFETGHELEDAILESLRLMRFTAKVHKDKDSEFDAIFNSPEGWRFLGEAEGKDRQAINIDKLRQLEMNLHEEFEKSDAAEFAKGVLFGNPERLIPLEKRKTFFTEKCVTGAKRAGIALVYTPSLFHVARYLKEHDDPEFAKQCREAIFSCSGEIVNFPQVPE